MIWSSTVSLLGKTFHFKFQVLDTPRAPTVGMSARIPGTCEFVVFMDYDNIKDERLKEELKDLQEIFHLGDFHVLETNEYGRHTVCFDRMTMREALAVVWESTCDYNFKRGIRINEYRTWILRVLEKGNRPKPKYLYTVESPYNGQRLQSQAHALFLQTYYGANVRLVNPDGNTKLEIQGYKTANKLDVKESEKIIETLKK